MKQIRFWCLPAVLSIAACGDKEQANVVGSYALDSAGLAQAVTLAAQAGDPSKPLSEDVAKIVYAIRNTAVVLALRQDGTFLTSSVASVGDQSMTSRKTGVWKRDGEKVTLTTTERDGAPSTEVSIAEIEGDQLVMWEQISAQIEVRAIFARQL